MAIISLRRLALTMAVSPATGRPSRFDVLLEPVQIGPVTARNRFFQVPHCNGMGYRDVSAHAGMREVKAEGGWAVICTEQAEIHHSSEITPFIELRIWDDRDVPAIARIAERIHAHGALAGIELCYNGMNGPNLYSRAAPMGPSHLPVATFTADPVQARAMGLDDIADLRRWHRAAVRRSLRAGYDLVYVYSGHALGGIHHFLSRRYNDRVDAYGGSALNRMRLLREILEDTLEEADGQAAVACRITVDELLGDDGITREDIEDVIGELGELPDLWDFVLGSWEDDSVTARFGEEAEQERYVRGLKALTSKPIVGVGRFTSPDTMVRMVSSGVLDLIGAARPSIADPFLPRKIEEGRLEDIRECIGCNICVAGDFTSSPIRCTQNPSMGEEWRRGWHPERIRPRTTEAKVLVVGGGPAGLEAAQSLGKRGYEVILADRSGRLGGRVALEARLPGMASYIRVADYRLAQLRRLRNVEQAEGEVTAEEILGYDFDHVAIATGARWRDDGVGRFHTRPIERDPALPVFTPDNLMAGVRSRGRASARVRRRPLLHGRRAGRTARPRGAAGHFRDTRQLRVELDDRDDGAASDPAAAVAARRRARHLACGHRARRRRRAGDVRVHRPRAHDQRRRRRVRDGAAAGRRCLPTSSSRRGPAGPISACGPSRPSATAGRPERSRPRSGRVTATPRNSTSPTIAATPSPSDARSRS